MFIRGKLQILSSWLSSNLSSRLSLCAFLFVVCAAGAAAQTCVSTNTVQIANGVGMQCVNPGTTVEYDWLAPGSGASNSLGTVNVLVNGASAFAVSPAVFASQGALVTQSATVSGGTIAVSYVAGSTPLLSHSNMAGS